MLYELSRLIQFAHQWLYNNVTVSIINVNKKQKNLISKNLTQLKPEEVYV